MIIKYNTFEPWPIKDKSVQAVITSPPYWKMRQYNIPDIKIKGETSVFSHRHKPHMWVDDTCVYCGLFKGQYGQEKKYLSYVYHTLKWIREVNRILKDDGIFFLNLGDTYSGYKKGNTQKKDKNVNTQSFIKKTQGIKPKCKLMIPQRIAIDLIDNGWILRNNIIWYKRNVMPEPCKDRFSKKYENVFMFTKNNSYYFDIDAVKEKCKPLNRCGGPVFKAKNKSEWDADTGQKTYRERMVQPNNGMKNPGDVWDIPNRASKIKHFAQYPEQLVTRMILCSTRANDVVLDPFCGSGMTLFTANKLNRKAIGFDLGYQKEQKQMLNGSKK